MNASITEARVLHASTGEFPLHEYRLRLGGRDWGVLHTGALLTHRDEADFFQEFADRLPYGVALWPAAIALAHEVVSRARAFHGKRVLELGAGTGLPGIVAASLGALVVQTDRHEVAMSVCRRNGEHNGIEGIEHRLADWTAWDDSEHYHWILGSDILYGEDMHAPLRAIFEANLAPGGRILLGDPFRPASFLLLEALEEDGWRVAESLWRVGEEPNPRTMGIFELAPPE